ncbi:hypothetical protein [Luteolibacter sp. AS25]|uniref:hypothetical protein n=1 Tax=Luteolibacter sp. AS25 TaxID=3135776 RepID=UPI00398B4AF8
MLPNVGGLMFRFSFFLAVLFCVSTSLQAQLATSLRLSKKTYVAGEPVIAEIIITNHSGRELALASSRQLPWLAVTVTDSRGNPVATRRLNTFGAMKIKVGESLAKQVDLTQLFYLDNQGNYAVSAVVRDPSERVQGASTNRVLFNLNPGRKYWSQKVGVNSDAGSGTREFRLLVFTAGQKSQLFAQLIDSETGTKIRTFLLGDALMLRAPMITLDGKQRMHVMFMATPTMWVHCQVSADAKLVARDIHQRAAQGDPVLMAYGDGSVRVVNSVPYDAAAVKEQESKIRKASERPH